VSESSWQSYHNGSAIFYRRLSQMLAIPKICINEKSECPDESISLLFTSENSDPKFQIPAKSDNLKTNEKSSDINRITLKIQGLKS
jgi:hypothetical protein